MNCQDKSKHLIAAAILAPMILAASTATARADATLPSRKPGLWQTTMTMNMKMNGQPAPFGNKPFITAMCVDAATDAQDMKKMAGANANCTKFTMTSDGGTYTMDGSCTDPHGGTMTIHGVLTKESDTEFHMHSLMTSANMSGDMTGESKWTGACPAGMSPGDHEMMMNGQFIKLPNNAPPPQQ